MPRRHRRAPTESAASSPRALAQRTEAYRGTDYTVRSLRGTSGSGGGPYRCPGCDQLVPADAPHIVAWPSHDIEAQDRRHWHTPCWANRETRAPRVIRPR